MISGNMVGSYSQIGKTFVLVDENGTELTGVVVDNPVVFTAGDNDVREGKVYASDSGVSTGTKDIPAYHTSEGCEVIMAGNAVKIVNAMHYEYTKLQVLICTFNSNIANSVATEKVSIDGTVYNVGSDAAIATVTLDSENKAIDFGIVNEGSNPLIIRYFMYKEIY